MAAVVAKRSSSKSAPAAGAAADTARALGEAVIEAVHVLSSPLNSLQIGVDMQRTLLERGRAGDAQRNIERVGEEFERVVDLARLIRDWGTACAGLAQAHPSDRLPRRLRARADAQTRMFVDPDGHGWIGGRADGALGFVVAVLVDIAFEHGATAVDLELDRIGDVATLAVRGAMPANAEIASGRHAGVRVRRVLLEGLLHAAGATMEATREPTQSTTVVRLPLAPVAGGQ